MVVGSSDLHVTRSAIATAVLLCSLATAQPDTYFVPIAARTPASSPVGATALQTSIWLPDPGVDAAQSLLFGTGGGASIPFRLDTQAVATLTALPLQANAVAAAPGVLIGGSSRTLLAVSSGGTILFGTVELGAFVPRGPATPIAGGSQIALSAVRDGGAALLLSDGFQVTRYDLDVSSGNVAATRGLTGSAAPNSGGFSDESSSLTFDGTAEVGFVGGRVVGDLYAFDARLDAGAPTVFDAALASQGRLSPPVTGLAVYAGRSARYLLAANGQGITVYDLLAGNPRATAFRVIPRDALGPITAPAGVAVTNLPAGTALPAGVIAVGDRTQTDLALVRWDVLATQVDGGLVIDTTTDPRGNGGDAGTADGGVPDAGNTGGGGISGGGGPMSPGIPVDHPSGCASSPGGAGLAGVLAVLLLLVPLRRQRR